MKLLQTLLYLCFLLAAAPCSAQLAAADPIDAAYVACIGKDTSAGTICNCAFTAYDKWNSEMERNYNKLLKTLRQSKDKEALKAAQAAWTGYRDMEFKSFDNMFNIPGSKWCRMRQDGRIDVVRERALQLQKYLEALKSRR